MVKRVWEDAMHRVESETLDDTNDVVDTLRCLSHIGNGKPDDILTALKHDIAGILKDAGFPDPGKNIFHKGGFWCDVQDGERPAGKAISPGWAFARSQSEPLTPEHEAASLYMDILFLEGAMSKRDMEKVFFHSLNLGLGINRFNTRRRHLKRITIRKKSERGLRQSSYARGLANAEKAARAAQWKSLALKMAEQYKARHPTASKSNIANWIRRNWPKDAGVGCPQENTIRQAL